jgi:hypothetical protein
MVNYLQACGRVVAYTQPGRDVGAIPHNEEAAPIQKENAMADTTPTSQTEQRFPELESERKRLEVFIGKWINEGQTVAGADASSQEILTSDIYDWIPGKYFVLHVAYGRIGNKDVGSIEIIGYDAASRTYRSHFFDNRGAISIDELTVQGDTWTWEGDTTGATSVFSDNGKTQTTHHVRLAEDGAWIPAMEVTLTKVE